MLNMGGRVNYPITREAYLKETDTLVSLKANGSGLDRGYRRWSMQ